MNTVAKLRDAERAELFGATANELDLHPVNVEKDFWVCWVLKQLFESEELRDWLVFKGGTSLSKCFGLIKRFSEDVDLAVDFERLGFTGDRDPRADMSRTARGRLLKEMHTACHGYIGGQLLPTLEQQISGVLGDSQWRLEANNNDPNSLHFHYPPSNDAKLGYIRPSVLLELGTHAEPIPNTEVSIQPFAADHFPEVFDEPNCLVTTVVAERTFWEKATILHAEHHRPAGRPTPPHYSRHYADLAVMASTEVREHAIADLGLLRKVCVHKDQFYRSGWAKYDEAQPGTLRLLPVDERLSALRGDYAAMSVMYFEGAPSFDGVLATLSALQDEINGL